MKAIVHVLTGLFSIGLIGLILWKLPVIEIMTMFFYIVLIPVALFVAITGVGHSALGLAGELNMASIVASSQRLRQKVGDKLKEKAQESPPLPTGA